MAVIGTENFFQSFLHFSYKDNCLKKDLYIGYCHYEDKNLELDWKYDLDTRQIIHLGEKRLCLKAYKENVTIKLENCEKEGEFLK